MVPSKAAVSDFIFNEGLGNFCNGLFCFYDDFKKRCRFCTELCAL